MVCRYAHGTTSSYYGLKKLPVKGFPAHRYMRASPVENDLVKDLIGVQIDPSPAHFPSE